MNLVDLFRARVVDQPDHPAILGPGKDDHTSYLELQTQIDTMAEKLRDSGVRQGDCIGLHCRSGHEYIVINYALWVCNACVVPIPVELSVDEKLRVCREIHMDRVISESHILKDVEEARTSDPSELKDGIVIFTSWKLHSNPPGFIELNPAFLRFSSGTTATAKGVVLSHETIQDRIHAANDVLALGPGDRIVWLLSMSYHFAVSIVAYLSFGAGIILCKTHFGRTIIEDSIRHQGTFIYGSPMHYNLMASDRSDAMLPNIRMAISTAMKLPVETATSFYDRFKVPLSQAYGIIEIGLPCINHDKPLEKQGSVGRVLPSFEIQLEDIGLGPDMREIKVRGKGQLDAYYEPWRTRDEIMSDGWFSTGDVGEIDRDGYLFIHARSKEMINVGGMKFFPQEVETVLMSHPAIEQAVVFSHEHRHMGEIGWADIVLNSELETAPTEEELISYCAKRLAPFKTPERIAFVTELARGPSGKIIRKGSMSVKQ